MSPIGCLSKQDGPMLEALKRLNGGALHLADRAKDRPDRFTACSQIRALQELGVEVREGSERCVIYCRIAIC